MLRYLLITSLYLAVVLNKIDSKPTGKPGFSPVDCFNNFQRFTGENMNADSAIFYIRKLAETPTTQAAESLRDLMHQSFAQAFMLRQDTDTLNLKEDSLNKIRIAFSAQLLQRMVNDTCRELKNAAMPVWQWYQIQQAGANTDSVKTLTQTFIKEQLSPNDIYNNCTGRYALLIHQLIAAQPELKPLADTLFTKVSVYLQENQIALSDSITRAELLKRAWGRALYAYINFKKSESTTDDTEKDSLLRIAFDNSPDLADQNNKSGYFYDMAFLFGKEKEGFKEEYIAFLTQSGKKNENLLPTLLNIALTQPTYKKQLALYYNNHKAPSAKSFAKFWMNAVDSSATKAPPVLLTQLNKAIFSTKQQNGKWILIDFWGTWCSPCRKEHPQIQEFYKSTVLKKTNAIALLTIACNDFKPYVIEYMKTKKYTFPVAMSNNKIEKTYQVKGYPTKVLITPTGKYIIVPFALDWVQFVRDYTSL